MRGHIYGPIRTKLCKVTRGPSDGRREGSDVERSPWVTGGININDKCLNILSHSWKIEQLETTNYYQKVLVLTEDGE